MRHRAARAPSRRIDRPGLSTDWPTSAPGLAPSEKARRDPTPWALACAAQRRLALGADVVLARVAEIEAAVAANGNLTRKWRESPRGFSWLRGKRRLTGSEEADPMEPLPTRSASVDYPLPSYDDADTAAAYEPYRRRPRLPPLPSYRADDDAGDEAVEEGDGYEVIGFS